MKYLPGMFLVLLSSTALAAPSDGLEEQAHAYGKVLGTYLAGVAFTEVCGVDPTHKSESEKTARNYLHENQTLLTKLRERVNDSIIKIRGKQEALTFSAGMKDRIPQMAAEARVEAKKQVVSKNSCTKILASLRSGLMDIKTLRGNEVILIMGK